MPRIIKMSCFGVLKNILRLTKLITPYSIGKIKLFLINAKLYINQRPKLCKLIVTMLTHCPALKNRLSQLATQPVHLSPRARRVYLELKEAMDRNNKENS